MTLEELRRSLARYLGLASTVQDGLVAYHEIDALNQAMYREGISLGIPRLSRSVPITSGGMADFTGLVNPVEAPLFASYKYLEQQYRLPILTSESTAVYPSKPYALWHEETRQLEVFSDFSIPSIQLVYQPAYAAMSLGSDTPWLNQYQRYHELIALSVAIDMATTVTGETADTLQARLVGLRRAYDTLYNNLSELVGGPLQADMSLKVVRYG